MPPAASDLPLSAAALALDIRHILPEGDAETHEATERRLLERANKAELPLFEDAADGERNRRWTRAYDVWWQRAR